MAPRARNASLRLPLAAVDGRLDLPVDRPVPGIAVDEDEADRLRAVVGRSDIVPEHGDQPMTPRRIRDSLAAALGVEADSLAGLRPAEASHALDRLQAMVRRLHALEARVTIDELTGVMRRGAGLAALHREVERARRTASPLVLAFVDADGLKSVNDTQGHAAGDALLADIAGTLTGRLRSYDLVFRYGGDEFVCVIFGTDVAAVEQILSEVAATLLQTGAGRTVSYGLADLTAEDSADTLLARADADLYARRRRRRA